MSTAPPNMSTVLSALGNDTVGIKTWILAQDQPVCTGHAMLVPFYTGAGCELCFAYTATNVFEVLMAMMTTNSIVVSVLFTPSILLHYSSSCV